MKNLFIIIVLLINCSNKINDNDSEKTLNNIAFKYVKKDRLHNNKTEIKFIQSDSIFKFLIQVKDTVKSPKNCKPFDTLNFNKVVAYEYFGEHGNIFIFNKSNHLFPKIEQQKALTQKQVDDICKLFSSKKTYGGITAACFDPHLCICFFNNNNCVMEISICLSCNFLESTVEISAEKSFPVYYDEGIGYRKGFSKKAQIQLQSFCKKLNFKSYKFPF